MLRRVVLAAMLSILVLPAVAVADSVNFTGQGGPLNLVAGTLVGSSTLTGVCNTNGGCPNYLGILGTIGFSTGTWNGTSFNPGGSITISSNASFPTIGAATLFSGTFVGSTLWFQSGVNQWTLSGAIEGTMLSQLYNLLGIAGGPRSAGAFLTLVVNFNGTSATISSVDIDLAPVPEPGTLALFGTGLIGMAGIIRRRLKA